MEREYEHLVQEVVRLVAAGADREQVLAKGREGKTACIGELGRLWRALTLLDNLVLFVAPDATWDVGWGPTTFTANAPTRASTSRAQRILEIAWMMIQEGQESVKTKDIADRLRSEGETASVKNLSTATGNVLARTEGWRKIGDGEYAPVREA